MEPKIPAISWAPRGHKQELQPNALMLKGAYKNDLRTRLFFKSLIGEHFHFTAFGIDWLNERWINGAPPTYREFSEMWREEFQNRQKTQRPPKDEWAYIRFTQQFLRETPRSSRQAISEVWTVEKKKQKAIVEQIFKEILGSI